MNYIIGGIFVKEFDINNKNNARMFKIFTIVFISLMGLGLSSVWFGTTKESMSTSLAYTIIVLGISALLILYRKNESDKSKIVIVASVAIYFYTLFLLYPSIFSTYILVCILPAIPILFFNKPLFYYLTSINIAFNVILYTLAIISPKTVAQYTYITSDLTNNLINFFGSQAILIWIFVITFSRMTKLKEYHERIMKISEDKLEYMAYHDALTGIYNRSYFQIALNKYIQDLPLKINKSCALMCIDLDNFKKVNDTLGHDAGDILLIEIASRITNCLRSDSDIASRMGGDEFSILLPFVHNKTDAEEIASRLLQSFSEPIYAADINIVDQFKVTASIGIVVSDHDNNITTPESLLKQSDIAMYEAKNSGKNKFYVYNEQI